MLMLICLFVWEPSGLYAPWTGQTTPNGYFSGDSSTTNVSAEYYVSNDYVESGPYDAFIYYYADGPTSTNANVTFWYLDLAVDNLWHSIGPVTFSNDNLKLTTCDNRILTTLSGERKAG